MGGGGSGFFNIFFLVTTLNGNNADDDDNVDTYNKNVIKQIMIINYILVVNDGIII